MRVIPNKVQGILAVLLVTQLFICGTSAFSLGEFIMKSEEYVFNTWKQNKSVLTVALVIFVLGYIGNYFAGKGRNQQIAERWVSYHMDTFKSMFKYIGISNTEVLSAESLNYFKFHASGNDLIKFLIAKIDLKKRQELLTMLVMGALMAGRRDRVSIEIALPSNIPTAPVVFALIKKKNYRTAVDKCTDLAQISSRLKCDGLKESYQVLAEHDDIMNYLFDQEVLEIVNKYEKLLQVIYITDCKTFCNENMALRIIFNLEHEKKGGYPSSLALTKLLFTLAHKISTYKLPANLKAKAEKDRAKYQAYLEEEERKESGRDRNTEKKKKEKKKDDNDEKKPKKVLKVK